MEQSLALAMYSWMMRTPPRSTGSAPDPAHSRQVATSSDCTSARRARALKTKPRKFSSTCAARIAVEPRVVVVGRHFDQVDADASRAASPGLQHLQHLVVEKTAVARRAGARCDRRAEAVDVQRDVDPRALGNAGDDAFGSQLAHLPHRQNVRAHGTRRVVALLRGRGDVANADLGQPGDVVLLGGTTQRAAVAVPNAVPLVDEVEVRVDMQDVDRALACEGLDAGDVDRVVAADHHREGAGVEDGPDAVGDVGVAAHGVGVDDVGVADVDDPHRRRQVRRVVLVVVGAGMAEGEERRGLAHRARAEAGTGAELRAEVEWGAEDRDVGVDGGPVLHVGALAEGRDSDEGEVQPAAVVGMITHLALSSSAPAIGRPAWRPCSNRALH